MYNQNVCKTNISSDRTPKVYENNIVITYNCNDGKFIYPMLEEVRPLWQVLSEDNCSSEETINNIKLKINEISASDEPCAYFAEYFLKSSSETYKWYRVGFISSVPHTNIIITFTDINDEVIRGRCLEHMAEYDVLTGLLNRNAFCHAVENEIEKSSEKSAMIYFDILRFKAINDMFGMSEGNKLLIYISDMLKNIVHKNDYICRIDSDRFIVFLHTDNMTPEEFMEKLLSVISEYDIPFEINLNAGIYISDGNILSADAMIDRAILAQSSIKGSYTTKYGYYKESLRNEMLSEQEITGMMATALSEKQFVIYLQPQYNHSTGRIVGAEALVRWKHPERGLISPGVFIPIFERNGFISTLDLYVFEEACRFIRKCIDNNYNLIPVSSNFSRHDIFLPNFAEKLEEIRKKYDVPVKYLRIEITESAVMGNNQHINEIIAKLHEYGYIIEMDDFGSGYSSLNVLKDIELDIIKLDMHFLSEKDDNNRGGTILSSVVRMAKWLSMPVIAEGVETVKQADFLNSIGCDYIQGYLYSRPLPEEEYEKLIKESNIGKTSPQMEIIETMNVYDFWNPNSQETLIFSNYVGGAAIFDYHDGKLEILRVNKKYLEEICVNISEKEIIQANPLDFFDEENKAIYLNMLERAIQTNEEEECETWRMIKLSCCKNEEICIRSTVRMIGKSDKSCLFYAMIRNITAEKSQYNKILDSERRFKIASEQVNIYYWEYTVETKEMRPCFRCMRDLGLPALLTNYPEPVIENGIFPSDYADMYRDWHKQVEEGVSELEAVIPLTTDRVPFRVRYTTEFDKKGKPVKAYGSAALIV